MSYSVFFRGPLSTRLLLVLAYFSFTVLISHAQDRSKNIPRLGLLVAGSVESSRAQLNGLRKGLEALGFIEDRNFYFEYRFANGNPDRLDALAADLVKSKVDVIITGGDLGTFAAKRATATIAIVAVTCDALASGIVTSLSRPGGNLTGITCINSHLAAKRVELFKETIPQLNEIGVIFDSHNKRSLAELSETQRAATIQRLTLRQYEVSSEQDIENAFIRAAHEQIKGVVVIYGDVPFFHRAKLAESAKRNRIFTIFNFRQFVAAGGLMSFGPSLTDMYRQSARHVDKVLKGENAGDIPIEQPALFELVVNLKTAEAVGLQIPSTLLARVDELIE